MAWVILVIAGLFEVGWAVGLKYTEGFTKLWPTAWTALAMIISLWLLDIAMKPPPVSSISFGPQGNLMPAWSIPLAKVRRLATLHATKSFPSISRLSNILKYLAHNYSRVPETHPRERLFVRRL